VSLSGKDSLKTANKAAAQLEADAQSRFSGVRKKNVEKKQKHTIRA
jgi:hypothetical protein